MALLVFQLEGNNRLFRGYRPASCHLKPSILNSWKYKSNKILDYAFQLKNGIFSILRALCTPYYEAGVSSKSSCKNMHVLLPGANNMHPLSVGAQMENIQKWNMNNARSLARVILAFQTNWTSWIMSIGAEAEILLYFFLVSIDVNFWISSVCPPPPPPQVSGCILFAHPPPRCTCSLTGGFLNVLGAQTEKIPIFYLFSDLFLSDLFSWVCIFRHIWWDCCMTRCLLNCTTLRRVQR